MPQSKGQKNSIIWFRKGLRVHDNPALIEACRDAQHVYPIFIIDPHFLHNSSYRVGVNRYNFLLECLNDLDQSLRALGSQLLVLRGTPQDVFPRIFKEWDVQQLCYEVDVEPYAKSRDAAVGQLAAAAGVAVSASVSHTLYDTDVLLRAAGGRAPQTMQAFTKLIDKVGDPPAPLSAPASLPPPGPVAEAVTSVPTLAEVGYQREPTTVFKGGESQALVRLGDYLADAKWVCAFEKPKTDPSAFVRPATTVLSPYLKFGCLSPRLFHARLMAVYRGAKGVHSKPPVSLRGQLLWREFFYTVGSTTPNFDAMAGNPLAKQIPWDTNPAYLAAWKAGRTGYPWIDAAMRQLSEWGWMHHLARHSVACFLTRGDLYISWEAGKAVFEELLLDADHFLNAANWMWLSASAFFNQYYRVYSPVTFGKKYDPEGKFIRRFVPELALLPTKYIYEPWTAPLDVQQRCGCIIGKDYPFPVVDHTTISKVNMGRMKAAYEANREAAGAAAAAEAGSDADGSSDAEVLPASNSSSRRKAGAGAAAAAGGSRRRPAAVAKRGGAAAAAAKKQRTVTDMFAAAAVTAAANGNGVAAGVAAACGVDAGDAVVPEL
uniref:Photolyase/cryptochrome alpha/beta domain-containing protein n=1 Tax=Tetradesmus obliquus TaxID=3088 RepID=A0A383VLE2_TETOB|eukprot:jgi/Sobl393_1/8080/SZX65649.1